MESVVREPKVKAFFAVVEGRTLLKDPANGVTWMGRSWPAGVKTEVSGAFLLLPDLPAPVVRSIGSLDILQIFVRRMNERMNKHGFANRPL